MPPIPCGQQNLLGCIGAAAAGQIEFGIPCVVGGAVSSAGLHYWETQN